MNTLMIESDEVTAWEGITSFGDAKLVRDMDDTFHIIGGSLSERTAARQWAAKFLDVKIP